MSKTIVVVGAGFFGISTANRLAKASKSYKVKLVASSDYAYFTVSSIRVPVYNKPDGTVIPLKDVVNENVEIVTDEVLDFNEYDITLKKNGIIEFDALIIATGSKWPEPISSSQTFGNDYKQYFTARHEEIEKAKSIVLIGGGFNNIELGGELFDKYESQLRSGEKKITLIHSADKLLPDTGVFNDKLRQRITDFFKYKSHFKLILNTKASFEQVADGTYEINTGEKVLKADLVYHNVGVVASVPKNTIEGLTNDNGFIRVQNTFQIEASQSSNIFAIGDVADFKYKGILYRSSWMDTLTFNVEKVLSGAGHSTLKTVTRPTGPHAALVSVGKSHGYGQVVLPFFGVTNLPSFAVVFYKSKTLGVPFAKGLLGNS